MRNRLTTCQKLYFIKRAFEDPSLARCILRFVKSDGRIKLAGGAWLHEFVPDKNLKRAFNKLRKRDYAKLQEEAIRDIYKYPEESRFYKNVISARKKVEVLESKRTSRSFSEGSLQEARETLEEAERNLQEDLDRQVFEIKADKLDDPMKMGVMSDRVAYSGNFASKQGVRALQVAPMSLREAEKVLWEAGKTGDKWDENVLAVPVGAGHTLDGWLIGGVSPE